MSKIELFDNERASGYNQFVETWIPGYRYFLDCLPRLLRDMKKKELLVAGCGTGNEIEKLIQAYAQWKITGIDPSPAMIKQAKDQFRKYDNVTLIEGLVSDLDIEKKYDAATLLLVLHFLEDDGSKLHLLKDIAARLVPGAMLVLLDITGDSEQINQNLHVLRLFLPDGVEEELIHKRLHRIANELYPVSENRLSQLCIEAGFEPPLRFFQSSIYMGWLIKKME